MVIGRSSKPGNRMSHRGLTLIECVLAMVLLPLAVTAISLAIVAGQSQEAEALRRTRAALLAEALMEQALAQPYVDLEDFCDNYSETPGNLLDPTGTAYPQAMQQYTRTIDCQSETITIFGQDISGLTITVAVEHKGSPMIEIERFVAEPPTEE